MKPRRLCWQAVSEASTATTHDGVRVLNRRQAALAGKPFAGMLVEAQTVRRTARAAARCAGVAVRQQVSAQT